MKTNENLRLNPFVYISETDIRFYLLVLIGIVTPVFWALLFGIIISAVMLELEITIFLRLLIIVFMVLLIPTLIYVIYRRYPKKIINRKKLKNFDKERHNKEWNCIEKLCSKYLPIKMPPILMFRASNPKFAMTFGSGNNLYIAIFGKLHKKFKEDIGGFKSIFLHELGHIVNKDVKKVCFAESTWQSLKSTLSIPFGFYLLYNIYLGVNIFILGIREGYNMDYIFSKTNLIEEFLLSGGIGLYFLIFMTILYVLRKQILRLREFYADAKVLEWEQSPDKLVKALQEENVTFNTSLKINNNMRVKKWDFSNLYDRAKSHPITKVHPSIGERIQLLKDNSMLFTSSLWVAFTVGFFYSSIELLSIFFKSMFSISSEEWIAMGSTGYQQGVELNVALRAFISLLIFTVLMIAVSSNFHKSALKGIFIDKSGYLSTDIIFNILKFSFVFSLGWVTFSLALFPIFVPLYETSILIGDLFDIIKNLVAHAVYFSIILIFLQIFSSMLIRRSFSKKEAMNNFLTITVFSSILYVVNRFVAIEILHSKPLLIVNSLLFCLIVYIFIKIKDRKVYCPNCNEKITDLSELKLSCPNCHHDLYSWAIYSFSDDPCS